jgi:hypothetical protein
MRDLRNGVNKMDTKIEELEIKERATGTEAFDSDEHGFCGVEADEKYLKGVWCATSGWSEGIH